MEHNTANNPGRNPQNKKRPALIAAGCAAGLVIIGLCVWFFWLKGYLEASGASPVYVSSVASITGAGVDTDPRYSGLVEPQKITKINKDDTRTVSEVLVAEGDPVSVGTPLFRYDTGEMDLSIRWRASPTRSPPSRTRKKLWRRKRRTPARTTSFPIPLRFSLWSFRSKTKSTSVL